MTIQQENLQNWHSILNSNSVSVDLMSDLIKYPVITEKSYLAMFKNRQYTFDVDLRLTKTQIRALFESLFGVNVIAINTHRPPRQKRRLGTKTGYKPLYKRVILTLKEGQSLNFKLINS